MRVDLLAVVFVVFCHFPKCLLVHIRIKGEVGLSPPVNVLTDRSSAVLLLWIICVIYVLCCRAFASVHAALWSTAGKGLTSWLLFVMFNGIFVTFPCGILGQM